jgi:hypothetical protein
MLVLALQRRSPMLSGSVLRSALMHGELPSDDVIAATFDLLLCGLGVREGSCPGSVREKRIFFRTDPG